MNPPRAKRGRLQRRLMIMPEWNYLETPSVLETLSLEEVELALRVVDEGLLERQELIPTELQMLTCQEWLQLRVMLYALLTEQEESALH
tara:strand:- start:122 stop:388 length:267 start_codon:yes stop_codon:yes gene_type:complete